MMPPGSGKQAILIGRLWFQYSTLVPSPVENEKWELHLLQAKVNRAVSQEVRGKPLILQEIMNMKGITLYSKDILVNTKLELILIAINNSHIYLITYKDVIINWRCYSINDEY